MEFNTIAANIFSTDTMSWYFTQLIIQGFLLFFKYLYMSIHDMTRRENPDFDSLFKEGEIISIKMS